MFENPFATERKKEKQCLKTDLQLKERKKNNVRKPICN
jgi:hypothetical protein